MGKFTIYWFNSWMEGGIMADLRLSGLSGALYGTTANRPATAQVGQIYYNGTTAKTQIYTATGWQDMASGIPFGNNAGRPTAATGQPYFNGEEKRLELYTSAGWQNIVSETPSVVSVSSTNGAVGATTLQITGTNFTTGAIASVTGTNGVEVQASSTTVNSIVSATASFTGLSYLNDPYDVKITNTSNLFGLLPDAFNINQNPIWVTTAGSLGSFGEQTSVTLSALSATDAETAITYTLASGSALPSGLSLNSSTGVISGTLPDIATDTTYTFTINASDGTAIVPRAFSITSGATFTAEALVVAGGGGGGSQTNNNFEGGCGGGAGGFVETTKSVSSGASFTVTVGAGGAFSNITSNIQGSNGSNSVFSDIVAIGGGVGGGNNNDGGGAAGGSGGGSPNWGDQAGGAALQPASASGGYGNAGGRHPSNIRVGGAAGGGGGGGGAGSAGGDAPSSFVGGSGGAGRASSITGTSTLYAGGGGGYGRDGSGSGGSGGGGAAGTSGTSGTANTGGGGGGSQNGNSGTGGSGVVIIAYPDTKANLTIGSGLSYTQPTRSGYKVYRFTGGTGTVTF